MAVKEIWPWLLICFAFTYVQSIEINLQPNIQCSNGTRNQDSALPANCTTLDMVLEGMQSNTTLSLGPGNYTVRRNYIVMNKSDVSIRGNPDDPRSVIIECDEFYGLVFVNIKRLIITGLTVRDCGFKGTERVQELFNHLETFLFLFFAPPVDFSTGVFLVYCQDLVVENVTIENNEGFGLVGINIVGDSRFSYVNLISNFPVDCIRTLANATQPGGSGGGMFILYQDFIKDFELDLGNSSTFIFEHGHVEGNYNCRLDLFAVQYNKLSRSLEPALSQENSIIGSGGVTVNVGQSSYAMNVTFTNCNITGNSGLFHTAGMEVTQFEVTSNTHVYVRDTIFYKNGGRFFGRPEFGSNSLDPGGALVAAFYAPVPPSILNSKTLNKLILQDPSSIELINCTFSGNKAQSGSGVSVVSFGPVIGFVQDIIRIQNCRFVENEGDYGSALFITEISYSAFEPGLLIYLDSIEVVGNRRLEGSTSATFQADGTSVVDINYVNVSLSGTNVFHSNLDTALAMYSGILTLSGSANFTSNVGSSGGALHLETESYLVLTGEAKLLFKRNRGLVYGGAIYVDFNTVRSNKYDCFLFIDCVEIFCNVFNRCPLPNNRFNISFIENTAPFGRAIYGSSFASCPWNLDGNGLQYLSINDTANGTLFTPDESRLPVFFDPPFDPNDNNSTVNTKAETIRADIPTMNSSTNGITVEVTPGQLFFNSLGAFDQLNQPIPLTIFSQLSGAHDDDRVISRIAESNRFLLAGGQQQYFTVPMVVFGEQNVTYNVSISSNEALADLEIEVHLKNCSDGFFFYRETLACTCEISMFLVDVFCTNNGLVSYPENNWIGRDENDNYIQAECILDYCKPNVSSFNFSEKDIQCRPGRSGILCGKCVEGYSRKIGSTGCGVCNNNYTVPLILLFAVLGILLFVILAIFNITITDGYINGFIFYSNIVSVYSATFLPETEEVNGFLSRVLISILNLNFGFEVCFYNGATELELAGLRLIFPIYLMLILLTVALCGKYITHKRVSSLFREINITHIFATLILYSYTSITQTCIALLGSVTVDSVSPQPLRWLRDPNVLYTSDLHIFLVILSVVFLIIFVPFTVLLLIPKVSYRVPSVNKLKPLIDAFIAPFDTGKTFWISFRLIFRLVLFILASFGVDTVQLVAMSCLIVLLTILQAYIKPFRTASRNFIDMLVMVNLTIFSIIAIYLHPQIVSNVEEVVAISSVFFYIVSAMLLLLFAHYVIIRFKCSREPYFKVADFIKVKIFLFCEMLDQMEFKKMNQKSNEEVNKEDLNTVATHTSVELIPRTDNFEGTEFIALRETLLEDPSTTRNSNRSTKSTRTGNFVTE